MPTERLDPDDDRPPLALVIYAMAALPALALIAGLAFLCLN
jgi:hypothetical protein